MERGGHRLGAAARLRRAARGAAGTGVVAFCLGSPAAAQIAAPQGAPPLATTNGLVFSASVFGGYDTNETSQAPVGFNQSSLPNAGQLGGTLGLALSTRGTRTGFALSGSSAYRLDRPAGDLRTIWSHSAGTALSVQMTPRLHLQTSGVATYSPEYQFTLFSTLGSAAPGLVAAPTSNYNLSSQEMLGYRGGLGLSYAPSTRSSFEVSYNAGYIDFRGADFDITMHDVGGLYRWSVTKNVSLRAGYSFRQGGGAQLGTGGARRPFRSHNVDVGADYARALSITRRTSLSFGFGSAVVDYGGGQTYRALGHVALDRQFGRSGRADLAYRREMRFVEGFLEPLFSDTVGVNVASRAGRRIDISGALNYARGQVGLASGDFSSYHGQARMQAMLAGQVGAFAEYFYYTYLFDRAVLPGGSPRELDRHGVRVGLSLAVTLAR